MCITAECADPTEVGVCWRDDADWKHYSRASMRAILQALLKGASSLYLDLASRAHPRCISYHIDLKKMEQTNTSSGHKRAIKLIFPSSFRNPNSNFFNNVQHSIEAVDRISAVARFRLHNSSCLLVIRKGNIAEWAVDGKADAIVCPLRRWKLQDSKDMHNRSLFSSPVQTLLSEMSIFDDALYMDGKNRHVSDNIKSSSHLKEQANSVAASLHRASGPELQKSLQKCVQFATPGRCGNAVITSGFQLPASHIIHAIAPKYRSSQDVVVDSCGLLEQTYKGALALASANGMHYVAFPAVACGAGGFPVGVAAQVAMKVVGSSTDNGGVEEIHFVLMGEERVYKEWVMQASKFFTNKESWE
ncbi:hypothetical protein L7F22_005908 [Adiantum nelumboides]|nr:hypothetical protein [Adiantum nelumboides]